MKASGPRFYLIFPTPGYWEITGGVSGHRLTFVVEVEQVGDGPDWRHEHVLDGLTEGRYYTTRPDLFDGMSVTVEQLTAPE